MFQQSSIIKDFLYSPFWDVNYPLVYFYTSQLKARVKYNKQLFYYSDSGGGGG